MICCAALFVSGQWGWLGLPDEFDVLSPQLLVDASGLGMRKWRGQHARPIQPAMRPSQVAHIGQHEDSRQALQHDEPVTPVMAGRTLTSALLTLRTPCAVRTCRAPVASTPHPVPCMPSDSTSG